MNISPLSNITSRNNRFVIYCLYSNESSSLQPVQYLWIQLQQQSDVLLRLFWILRQRKSRKRKRLVMKLINTECLLLLNYHINSFRCRHMYARFQLIQIMFHFVERTRFCYYLVSCNQFNICREYHLSIYLHTYKSLVTLIDLLIACMIDCMFEAVRTNPGYGMATLIHNFWDFWELFFAFARKLGWIFMHTKTVSTILNFEIKYYNNIRANFLSYFNVNVYFITIIHYLNK